MSMSGSLLRAEAIKSMLDSQSYEEDQLVLRLLPKIKKTEVLEEKLKKCLEAHGQHLLKMLMSKTKPTNDDAKKVLSDVSDATLALEDHWKELKRSPVIEAIVRLSDAEQNALLIEKIPMWMKIKNQNAMKVLIRKQTVDEDKVTLDWLLRVKTQAGFLKVSTEFCDYKRTGPIDLSSADFKKRQEQFDDAEKIYRMFVNDFLVNENPLYNFIKRMPMKEQDDLLNMAIVMVDAKAHAGTTINFLQADVEKACDIIFCMIAKVNLHNVTDDLARKSIAHVKRCIDEKNAVGQLNTDHAEHLDNMMQAIYHLSIIRDWTLSWQKKFKQNVDLWQNEWQKENNEKIIAKASISCGADMKAEHEVVLVEDVDSTIPMEEISRHTEAENFYKYQLSSLPLPEIVLEDEVDLESLKTEAGKLAKWATDMSTILIAEADKELTDKMSEINRKFVAPKHTEEGAGYTAGQKLFGKTSVSRVIDYSVHDLRHRA